MKMKLLLLGLLLTAATVWAADYVQVRTIQGVPVAVATKEALDGLAGGHDAVTLAGPYDYLTIAGQVITMGPVSISDDTDLSASSGVDLTAGVLTAVPGEIDHDGLLNFLAAEHIDWTADTGGTLIDINNIPDLSSIYHPLWDYDYNDLINTPDAEDLLPAGAAAGQYLHWDGDSWEVSDNALISPSTGTISFGVSAGTAGDGNIVMGVGAGLALSAGGDNNIILGNGAGLSTTTGDENILIMANASAATASNELNIADTVFGDTSTGYAWFDHFGMAERSTAPINPDDGYNKFYTNQYGDIYLVSNQGGMVQSVKIYDFTTNAWESDHDAVTIGTANGLSLSTQELSLAAATTSTPGAMTAAQATALAAIDTEAELEALIDHDDLNGATTGTAHDGRYYTETELNTSGAGGQVHWDNITDKPAGADHDAVTLGTPSNGLALSDQELTLAAATTSTPGAMTAAQAAALAAIDTEAELEALIDHDDLNGVNASEHIDWTSDQGATNIHAGNIPDLSGTYATVGSIPSIEDAAYDATWDGDTDGASKNAIYDKIESLAGAHDAVTIGTANGLSLSGQELSLAAATNSSAGAATAAQITALEAIDTEAEIEALVDHDDLNGASTGTAHDGRYPQKAGTETISGAWDFTTAPNVPLDVGSDITTNTTLDAAGCNKKYVATAACTVTLPAAATAGYGAWVMIRVRDASEILIIDVAGANKINLDGTALDAGDTIDSSGAAGDFIVLVSTTDADGSGTDGWENYGTRGAWVDGGAS